VSRWRDERGVALLLVLWVTLLLTVIAASPSVRIAAAKPAAMTVRSRVTQRTRSGRST